MSSLWVTAGNRDWMPGAFKKASGVRTAPGNPVSAAHSSDNKLITPSGVSRKYAYAASVKSNCRRPLRNGPLKWLQSIVPRSSGPFRRDACSARDVSFHNGCAASGMLKERRCKGPAARLDARKLTPSSSCRNITIGRFASGGSDTPSSGPHSCNLSQGVSPVN